MPFGIAIETGAGAGIIIFLAGGSYTVKKIPRNFKRGCLENLSQLV